MRKFLLPFAMSLALVACEDCDDGTSAANPNQDLIATFKIASVLIPEAVDVNQDGLSSSDLVHESNCHEPAFLTFNSDGTFRHRQGQLLVQNASIDCDIRTISGNWVRNGNSIAATPFATGEPIEFVFSPETNTITRIHTSEYPRINQETGNLETAQGEVTTVFQID